MSLEESMKELATSNLTLAKAMTAYAAVMDKYAATYGDALKGGGTPAATDDATPDADPAADKPARTRRTKAQIAADKKAEKEAAAAGVSLDPFADEEEEEEEEEELTLEDVREVVMALSKKDRDAALGVLKKVGAETISKIEPKNFQKVIDLCAEAGITR